MKELQESHSDDNGVKQKDHNSTEDKACPPSSQISDTNTVDVLNNENSELSSTNPLCEQVSDPLVPSNDKHIKEITEEAPEVQRSTSVEEGELSAFTPTRGQPNKSTFKRKAPPPPAQQQQQTQKEVKDHAQRIQEGSQSPKPIQNQVEAQNKVKRRAPVPPAQSQPDNSQAKSQKKKKRKAPVPAASKPHITVNQTPVNETDDQRPQSVVSIETTSSTSIRKEKPRPPQRPPGKSITPEQNTNKTQRPVPKSRTPDKDKSKIQHPVPKSRTPEGELTKTEQALKRRTSEKDTSKANQTGDMDELTNKKPRVRRKKEKAPLPPQPAATQPLPSTEEEEKTKKQLKELKAEEKKPKLLTVPAGYEVGGWEELPIQDASEYVVSERNALRNRQTELDKKAVGLEKQLRQAMKAGNLQREEILMQNWFALITEKNGLERREQELNLLEQEENLERRHELLKRELRKISTLEDWQKSPQDHYREKMLLDELVQVVNKRDELVMAEERDTKLAAEEDARVQEALSSSKLFKAKKQDEACVIQ